MTRLLSPLLPLVLSAGVGLAQDLSTDCERGEGLFYGAPFTLEQVFVLPGTSSPPPSGDNLFPDAGDSAAGADFVCDGSGIVGALDCVTAEIESAGADATISETVPVEAEALAAVSGEAPSDAAPPLPRVVRQLLVLKPVIVPGSPGQVSYVPAGAGGIEVPEDLSEAEIAALSPQIAARNAALLAYRGALTLKAQDDLIRGMPVPVPLPPAGDGLTVAGVPGVLAVGAECGALFRAMTETARLLQLRLEKVARIKMLKDLLKAERDKAGLLGLVWDSDEADRLERIIAFEQGNLAKIDQRLAEHQATIDRRERWLANEDRARELEAIKADPDRMAAETARRREAMIAAAQETARARWLMIEGEAAYARQLAAHDAMIKAARENGQDDLADKLEEDKIRLEAARDSWREHSQSMIDVRAREEARLMAENAADGIGPAMDARSMLLAEGQNPIEVIESGARERARDSAERRALTDAATLGGTATETYDALDFGQDLFETNLEMQRNPALFYSRFGAYVGGVGEAAYDGIVDLAVIGIETGDLAGEVFESHLSGVTGYEFNAFGRENLETLVAAGGALSEADALKIGELAGKVAEAADRKVSAMAASGEAGIRDALSTTGYIAGSVIGAEEVAMAGTMRLASAVRDAAKGAEALADAAKVAEGVTDASRIADAARIDTPLTPDVPVTPDIPASPEAPPTPDVPVTPDTPKVDPEDLTDTVKIAPEDLPDAGKIDPPDPDKTGPVPPPDPDPPPTPDPVDPDKTGPVPPPDPDAPPTPDPVTDPKPVDRDAVTERDPVEADPADPDAPPTPDPAADPKPVDRDAVTERDPVEADPADPDAPPTPDPAADPKPVDRDAVTERDPANPDGAGEGLAADSPDVTPDAPPKDPPKPDPAAAPPADPPPLPDEAATPDTPAAEPVPKPDPNGANQPRGPPETPREALPIDPDRLDTKVDNSDGYAFKQPLASVDDLPRGGKFAGDAPRKGIPGSSVTAPDGSTLKLGKFLGAGGTATVFANGGDPDTILKIVDAVQDRRALTGDVVGRKIGEKIQDASGNGNFRMSKVEQEFLVTNPKGFGSWSIKVEENMALADGITDAAKRFKDRPPTPEEELTMALAMREMNNRGVVWTDHKPENFDIVVNPDAPTGFQMVIFDTGGIRPVTGATPESRALTAAEVQRTFDRSSKPFGNPDSLIFGENYMAAETALDNRVFPENVGIPYTFNRATSRPKGDRYLDFALWSDAELLDYAKGLLGKEVKLPIKPP